MDQGFLENIKRLYSRDLLIRVLDEEDTSQESFIEHARKLTIRDVILMASEAWREVTSKTTVAKSWDNPQLALMILLNLALIYIQFWRLGVAEKERDAWLATDANDSGYHMMD